MRQSWDDVPRLLSVLIYGLSMVELYAVSALYHLGGWRGRRRDRLQALDHASIFILIAGTYTPVGVNVLSGWLRPSMLVLIWALAVLGLASTLSTVSRPRWVSVGLYVGMGWIAVLLVPSLTAVLPVPALVLLLTGGLLYTLGAIIYGQRRPDPFPRIFGFHEIFHLFVVAGSAVFLVAIWEWILPFPRV